ncbi:MAG: hypothetical protein JSS29_03100 [Proteobacteria bacterium]|nr:hypothetical protein [Pseudomonadota bacterium]
MTSNLSGIVSSLSFGMAFLALSACGGGGGTADTTSPPPPPPPPAAPVIESFAATPATISVGAMASLSWTSRDANACSITGTGAPNGTLPATGSATSAPLTASSSLTLACSGAAGTSAAEATIQVTVVGAPPVGSYSIQTLPYPVNDAVWDSQRGVLYLAIASTSSAYANSVVAFDPRSGTFGASVYVGSEPNLLAESDDGQYLYVGLAGADLIRRLSLASLVVDLDIPSDPDLRAQVNGSGNPIFAHSISVAPGMPQTIAVTRWDPQAGLSPIVLLASSQFEIFDDAVARAQTGAALPGGLPGFSDDALGWGSDPDTLYGATLINPNNPSTENEQVDIYSTATPVSLSGDRQYPTLGSFPPVIPRYGSLLFDLSGDTLDVTTGQVTQAFYGAHGVALPDSQNGRVFYADVDLSDTQTIQAFDLTTHAPLGTIAMPYATPNRPVTHLIRWGIDGLAVTYFGGTLKVIAGAYVAPGGPGTPLPAVTGQSGGGQYFPGTQTLLPVKATDIAFDATRELIYAALPATDSTNPSAIAVIDPTGTSAPVYFQTVASPSALAVSDDGTYLYVGTAGSVARYVLPGFTLDQTTTFNGTPARIRVAPGDAHTISVVISGLILLFTDGSPIGTLNGDSMCWGSGSAQVFSVLGNATPFSLFQSSLLGGSATVVDTETGKFSIVYEFPFGMTIGCAGGLVYGGTGVVWDPVAKGLAGSFAIGGSNNLAINGGPESQVLGVPLVDTSAHRVFYAVATVSSRIGPGPYATSIASFDTDTFTPVVTIATTLTGLPLEFFRLGPTAFVILAPDGEVQVVSDPHFAL